MLIHVGKSQSIKNEPWAILVCSSNSNTQSQKSPDFDFSIASGSPTTYSVPQGKSYNMCRIHTYMHYRCLYLAKKGKISLFVCPTNHRMFQKVKYWASWRTPSFLHLLLIAQFLALCCFRFTFSNAQTGLNKEIKSSPLEILLTGENTSSRLVYFYIRQNLCFR